MEIWKLEKDLTNNDVILLDVSLYRKSNQGIYHITEERRDRNTRYRFYLRLVKLDILFSEKHPLFAHNLNFMCIPMIQTQVTLTVGHSKLLHSTRGGTISGLYNISYSYVFF